MKKRPVFCALLLATSILVHNGCAKEPAPAPASETTAVPAQPAGPADATEVAAPVVAADPFVEMTTALEVATAAKHDGLSAVQQRMDRSIDNLITSRKAAGYSVPVEADNKLDDASDDFAEKLRQLTLTSPETWDSAKHNTELALQSVRSAYGLIMSNETMK